MEIGDLIARETLPAGQSPDFTHALIAATPSHRKGGIGKHTDEECAPGSVLLAIGLEGTRVVKFDMPVHGQTIIKGDYLATNGLHVDVAHEVVTCGYTLSITYRTVKAAGGTPARSQMRTLNQR